jgi:hypothetical protein
MTLWTALHELPDEIPRRSASARVAWFQAMRLRFRTARVSRLRRSRRLLDCKGAGRLLLVARSFRRTAGGVLSASVRRDGTILEPEATRHRRDLQRQLGAPRKIKMLIASIKHDSFLSGFARTMAVQSTGRATNMEYAGWTELRHAWFF